MRPRIAIALTFLAFLTLFAPLPALAQHVERPVFVRYDVQSTSYIYGFLSGELAPGVQGAITTSGSSATWTAVNQTPFTVVSIGDRLTAKGPAPASKFSRTVTAKASSTSLTVHSAANLQTACGAVGCAWTYRTYTPVPGTTSADGWMAVPAGDVDVAIEVAVLGSTSVEYSVETRTFDGGPISLYTASIASATFPTNGDVIPVGENVVEIRVGLKRTGAGTNAVNVSLLTGK